MKYTVADLTIRCGNCGGSRNVTEVGVTELDARFYVCTYLICPTCEDEEWVRWTIEQLMVLAKASAHIQEELPTQGGIQ